MSGPRAVRTAALPLAVTVAIVCALLAGCSGDDDEPIEVAAVGRAAVSELVEAPATVVARRSATVTSPATGTVARLYVADGEKVGDDEILLRIDSPQARQALASAQEADASLAGTAPRSTSNSATTKAVRDANRAAQDAFDAAEEANAAIPIPEVREAAEAQLRAAKAQYAAAQAAVQRAAKQIDDSTDAASDTISSLTRAQRTQTRAAAAVAQQSVDALTVRAPVAGVVALGADPSTSSSSGTGDLSSLVDQLPSSQQGLASSILGGSSGGGSVSGDLERGTPVSSGQALLTITDVSRLSLAAQVDETDVLLVRPGVKADVELTAVPGAVYAATVRSVSNTATTSSRGGVAYVVKLRLGAGRTADGDVAPAPRPGMSAVARLRVREASDVVAVPAAAVFRDGARSSVWLVENGTAQRRTVRLGAQGEATYQILDGLEVGDEIVVRGADRVREGQRVG